MTPNTSLLRVILSCMHYYSCIKQHTKFEVLSFINSKDMIGAKFKNGWYDPDRPTRG